MSVRVGDPLPPWRLEQVSAEKMKTMAALLADSNPIHFDLDAVRALGMGDRPVNQGPTNLAYVMNLLSSWAGGSSAVRRVRVRFQANVHGGDAVLARGRVTAVREEGDRRLAECEVELVVAPGSESEAVALSGTALVDVTDVPDHSS